MCYSCLVSNGEQRWGRGGKITFPSICAQSTANLQERGKCLRWAKNHLSILHVEVGFYVTGEREAGRGVSTCLNPSVDPLCFYVWGGAFALLMDLKGYLAFSYCAHSKQSKALRTWLRQGLQHVLQNRHENRQYLVTPAQAQFFCLTDPLMQQLLPWLKWCTGWFYVNVTQARIVREDGDSIEKMPPWYPAARHFIN